MERESTLTKLKQYNANVHSKNRQSALRRHSAATAQFKTSVEVATSQPRSIYPGAGVLLSLKSLGQSEIREVEGDHKHDYSRRWFEV